MYCTQGNIRPRFYFRPLSLCCQWTNLIKTGRTPLLKNNCFWAYSKRDENFPLLLETSCAHMHKDAHSKGIRSEKKRSGQKNGFVWTLTENIRERGYNKLGHGWQVNSCWGNKCYKVDT